MKVLLVLSTLLALATSTCDHKEHAHNLQDLLQKVTEKYHGEPGLQRLRRRSAQEYKEIQRNFAKSVEEADNVNSDASKTHSAEYNKISVMTDAERRNLIGNFNTSEAMRMERKRVERRATPVLAERGAEAVSIDWVARGAQNPAKNQGSCGSCWTFGASGPLEGNYYILTGEKKSFSEQEYLDCSVMSDGHNGCNGGWPPHCYQYNIKSGHMSLTSDVPYKATSVAKGWYTGKCKWSGKPNGFTKARLTSYGRYRGEAGFQTALQLGVLSVCIQVTGSFGSYRSGVWDCDAADCNSGINHAVAITGYGTQSGIRYWNVRNSWGKDWGDGGYIKMTRDGNGNVANIHAVDGFLPKFTCNEGQTCTTPEWDESSHEDDDIDDSKGKDVQCGQIAHSGGRCLSIDDSAEKWLDLSGICEREWCLTDQGYLYEKATDLCANSFKQTGCKNQYSDSSCNYWAGLNYCKEHYVAFMEGNCAKSCDLCGDRVRLQGKCTTKWTMSTEWNSSGAIKSKDDSRCMQPKAGGDTPAESTAIIPDKSCSAKFTFLPGQCWEMERGKKLTGGAELAKMIGEAAAKEKCQEMGEKCGGINWVEAAHRYVLVAGKKIEYGAAGDSAYALVGCDKSCNAGEKRCEDGDCRANCDCKASAGMRICPDGTCKHKHMAC